MEASASSLCLTTLEYAVKGSQPVVIHCPSCGIRLIIKHQDNLASRLTSVSLLVGMSMFICYNIGIKSGLMSRFTESIWRWFGGNGRKRKQSLGSSKNLGPGVMRNGMRYNPDGSYTGSMGSMNCSHMSAELQTNSDQDSGIDLLSNMTHRDSYYYDDDEFDGQFDELLAYNADYSNQYNDSTSGPDYYYPTGSYHSMNPQYGSGYRTGSEMPSGSSGEQDGNDKIRQVKTKTVAKIDQVLQSIDDIKKSIVEIDDDIYHIAGSTYDSYSPYFLTLSTTAIDEFDSMDSGSQNGWNTKEDFVPEVVPEAPSTSPPKKVQKSNLPHKTMRNSGGKSLKKEDKADKSVFDSSRPSRTSQSSMSDMESQLEWDFDFEPFSPVPVPPTDLTEQIDSSHIQEYFNDSESLQNPPESTNVSNSSLTDEQKLKNMNDLLDDAKRMGLLNNILEALKNEEYSSEKHHYDDNEHSQHSKEYS